MKGKMKKLSKRMLYSLATFGILAMPISSIVSCSSSSSENSLIILSGKTQVTDEGKEFAEYFQGINDFKSYSSDGAEQARFITRNGDKFATELSTTFGSKSFPSLYAAANPSTYKPYYDKNAITKFKDPKYNKNGVAQDTAAVEHNKKLAGDKVNEIIKTLQTSDRSSLMLKNKEGDILGFPTYSEAMGLIYNKALFSKAGITIDPTNKKTKISDSVWRTKIHDGSSPKNTKSTLTVNPVKDLNTPLKTKQLLEYIKAVLDDSSIDITGISTFGKESWAFTSKVLGTSGIATAAINADLNNLGVVMPGETYDDSRLTPDTAQSALFNSITSEGIITMKEAFEFFINETLAKNFLTNQGIYNAFSAGQLLTIPQGTWVESTLNKTKNLKYGYLPLPLTGTIDKIALDTVSHWIVSDQVNSHGRSEKQAKAFRTQAVNFIYNQYLTDEGAKNLEKKQGLNNPYRENKFLDENSHPLIVDANKYKHFKWGIAFNKPGVGSSGYERNNTEWTAIITKYFNGTKSINDVIKKALEIWK